MDVRSGLVICVLLVVFNVSPMVGELLSFKTEWISRNAQGGNLRYVYGESASGRALKKTMTKSPRYKTSCRSSQALQGPPLRPSWNRGPSTCSSWGGGSHMVAGNVDPCLGSMYVL